MRGDDMTMGEGEAWLEGWWKGWRERADASRAMLTSMADELRKRGALSEATWIEEAADAIERITPTAPRRAPTGLDYRGG